MTEVNKSLKAVKESCSSARLALDLNYERIKMEVVRALDDRYHSLVDVIEKSKKEDIDMFKNLEDQLNAELSHLQELTNKGMGISFSILYSGLVSSGPSKGKRDP